MRDRTLLVSQKNAVFRLLSGCELDVGQFVWRKIVGETYTHSQLVHGQSGYYFKFLSWPNGWGYEMSPGMESRFATGSAGEWATELTFFRAWALGLRKELEEPDLWETIRQGRALVETASDANIENSPLSEEEQQLIQESLEEVKQHLLGIRELGVAQRDFVERQFQYLVDASGRLGRKDWTNIFLSVLVSNIVGLALPSEAARALFRFATQAFQWFLTSPHFFPISAQ